MAGRAGGACLVLLSLAGKAFPHFIVSGSCRRGMGKKEEHRDAFEQGWGFVPASVLGIEDTQMLTLCVDLLRCVIM